MPAPNRRSGRSLPVPASLRKRLRRWWPRPRWGNLLRARPFSERYGFDRGTPVDRFLMRRFLDEHRHLFHGQALEVGDDTFLRHYGDGAVAGVDIVDIDDKNPRATIVADLGLPDALPVDRHDVVLIAQTLQYVSDVRVALASCWGALRPGGALIVIVPSMARIDPNAEAHDRWRFTPRGLRQLMEEVAGGATVDVRGLGNLPTAVAFLEGIAAEELPAGVLAHNDEAFPVLAAGVALKPPAGDDGAR